MTTSDVALPAWFAMAASFGICGFALWKGEWAERSVATVYLVGWGLTVALMDRSYSGPQWGGLAVDTIILGISFYIALKSDKSWTLWNAGFHLLQVITHTARILDPTVGAWAYATAGVIWGYLVLIGLATGTFQCVQRRRNARIQQLD